MFTLQNMSHAMCHVSSVTRHVSCVTYHISHVTCHMSCVTCTMCSFFFLQSGEVFGWRVCYERGLPRLVLEQIFGPIQTTVRIMPLSIQPLSKELNVLSFICMLESI